MSIDASKRAAPTLDAGTKLALERTFLAQERTLMAWVRTGLSLISFGFSIAKFFQYLHEQQSPQAPLLGPTTVGLAMIAIGLLALASASIQHHQALKVLRAQSPDLPRSTAGAVAVVIVLLGVLAVMGVVSLG
jgi:putative membrane protein